MILPTVTLPIETNIEISHGIGLDNSQVDAIVKMAKNDFVVIGKTMAAGSLEPQEGFQYAFENGADFICAGMYDFQIVQDTNYATQILDDHNLKRTRAWKA